MKKCIFLCLVFLIVVIVRAVAQPHISMAFELEDEWTLTSSVERIQQQGMVGCVDGDILYCCCRRGFQNKEDGYKAIVTTIDLTTGAEGSFALVLPEKKVNVTSARKYWIRGICIESNRLFLLMQNGILVYQNGKGDRYEFTKRIDSDLPDRAQSENGRLTVVERIPESAVSPMK